MSGRRFLKLQVKGADGVGRATGLRVELANTFWSRLVGLLGRPVLEPGCGLLLQPCTSIHTLGMRFSIDVIFLDRASKVTGFADAVPPNRFRFAPAGTVQVLEVAVGNRTKTGIRLDDFLIFD